MKLKIMFLVLMFAVPGIARAQAKSGKICVWADSEDPGVLMPTQPGGSVNSISGSEVQFIRLLIVKDLRTDKSNNVLEPCPQTGENIQLDVVSRSVSRCVCGERLIVITGRKDGPIHVSSNVVAAKTDELLAQDIAFTYASLKLQLLVGATK